MKLIIPGRPTTKKNSGRIVQAGKYPKIIPSKAFVEYETASLWHLKQYKEYFTGPIQVTCLYWMPDRRSWPDLIGLLQGTSDILEKAGIIENDRLIMSYDGSRIVGIDRENPRAEVEVGKYDKSIMSRLYLY